MFSDAPQMKSEPKVEFVGMFEFEGVFCPHCGQSLRFTSFEGSIYYKPCPHLVAVLDESRRTRLSGGTKSVKNWFSATGAKDFDNEALVKAFMDCPNFDAITLFHMHDLEFEIVEFTSDNLPESVLCRFGFKRENTEKFEGAPTLPENDVIPKPRILENNSNTAMSETPRNDRFVICSDDEPLKCPICGEVLWEPGEDRFENCGHIAFIWCDGSFDSVNQGALRWINSILNFCKSADRAVPHFLDYFVWLSGPTWSPGPDIFLGFCEEIDGDLIRVH